MHGLGLQFLLNNGQRANASALAYQKPLRDDDKAEKLLKEPLEEKNLHDKWNSLENIN
jgi:hypothetical protein